MAQVLAVCDSYGVVAHDGGSARGQLDDQLDTELQFHLDLEAKRLVDQGASPDAGAPQRPDAVWGRRPRERGVPRPTRPAVARQDRCGQCATRHEH